VADTPELPSSCEEECAVDGGAVGALLAEAVSDMVSAVLMNCYAIIVGIALLPRYVSGLNKGVPGACVCTNVFVAVGHRFAILPVLNHPSIFRPNDCGQG
jgi:hypothetical protein